MKMDMPDSPNIAAALQLGKELGVFGSWPRVLCVCSAAINRSPTLAWVLSREPYNCNTISAGSHTYKALVPVTQALLDWAQRVVFVSSENQKMVLDLGLTLPQEVFVLNITDSFSYRDPELIAEIHEQLARVKFRE